MATIRIQDLRLRCIIGIFEWEKKEKQDVILNIEIDFDASKSSQSDQIEDTVDYKEITKKIIAMVESSNFNLLEKLAQEVLDIVCAHPLVTQACVIIDKPGALRFADSVSVELTRSK